MQCETGDSTPLGPSVSASRRGPDLMLTFVNPKHDTAINVTCDLGGHRAESAKARLLHHTDFNACNTFEQPDTIVPRDHPVNAVGPHVSLALPALSIATAIVRLS